MTIIDRDDMIFSKSVSILRILMPFMIILIHAPFLYSGELRCQNGVESTIYILISEVISQLAVPAFFFISGYFFFSKFELTSWNWTLFISKIKKRLKTLLLPYILWNIMYILPSLSLFVLGRLSWSDFSSNLNLHIFWDIYSSPTTNIIGITRPAAVPLDGPLWFIRDLMVCCLFAPVGYLILRKFKMPALILGGAFYIFDIWIPYTGFSKSFVLFMLGAWFMLNKYNPIIFFNKIKKTLLFLTVLFMTLAVVWYGNTELLFSIMKRLFRLAAIPTLFLAVSNLLVGGKIQGNKVIESCGFFIFAMHYFIALSVFTPALIKFCPGIIKFSPLLSYLLIAVLTYLLCIFIKIAVDRITPKIGYYLNGCR